MQDIFIFANYFTKVVLLKVVSLIVSKIFFLNKFITYSGEYNLYAFQSVREFMINLIFLNIFISSSFELYIIALSPKILICSKSPQLHVIIGLFFIESVSK